MAISSLTKFTVPLPGGETQGLLMPKLKYRFRVTLEGFGFGTPSNTELTKQVIDVTRPTVAFDPITVDVYNSRVYLAGKHTWSPITLNVRDDVNGNVSKLVGAQLQKQFDFLEQASAASGADYKFTTRIEILDGGNGANAATTLETWELYGCYLENVNYQNLSYSENAFVTVQMSIKYDNAVQTPQGSGAGAGAPLQPRGDSSNDLITGAGV